MQPEGFSIDPVMAEFQRTRAAAKATYQRIKTKLFRRRIMGRLFERDRVLTDDGRALRGTVNHAKFYLLGYRDRT